VSVPDAQSRPSQVVIVLAIMLYEQLNHTTVYKYGQGTHNFPGRFYFSLVQSIFWVSFLIKQLFAFAGYEMKSALRITLPVYFLISNTRSLKNFKQRLGLAWY